MKSFAVVLAAATAVASVNAATCDTTGLASLLTESYVTTCATDSGYSFTSLATPDSATLAKMCTSTACAEVLTAVEALNLGDCTVGTLNVQDLIDLFVSTCSGSSSTSAAAGSSSSEDNTVEVTSSTSSTTSDSTTTSSTTSSTSGSSTASSSTTTSGAASVALASGAMVFATAAMFL